MKKTLILAMFICAFGQYGNAQVNPHAIGLRLGGDGDINGAEISYQHGFGEGNRLELDMGFGSSRYHNRLMVTGIYHWVWHITEGLNWYVGPGAGIGLHSYDDRHPHYHEDEESYLNVALGGQIGLDYDFNTLGAPLLLSLDVRPMWDFLGYRAGWGWGAALGIRYTW